MLFDREGILWLGTHGGGLNRLKDGKFSVLTTFNGLSGNEIFGIMEDSRNRIWIATVNGVNIWNRKKGIIKSLTEKNGLSANFALTMTEDSKGAIWIGTRGKGVSVYKNGKFKYYNTANGLSNDRIYAIMKIQKRISG